MNGWANLYEEGGDLFYLNFCYILPTFARLNKFWQKIFEMLFFSKICLMSVLDSVQFSHAVT